jgi:hypothetical protein
MKPTGDFPAHRRGGIAVGGGPARHGIVSMDGVRRATGDD